MCPVWGQASACPTRFLGQAKACPHSGLLAYALCEDRLQPVQLDSWDRLKPVPIAGCSHVPCVGTGFSLSNSLKACPYSGLVACALCGDRLQPVQLYSYRFKTNAEFFDPKAIVLHTA